MTPTIGRIVHYCLTEHDAERINIRRESSLVSESGSMYMFAGNVANQGDVFPAMIVRVNREQNSSINAQVQLDGNDTLWVTSVTATYDAVPGRWFWPPRVPA